MTSYRPLSSLTTTVTFVRLTVDLQVALEAGAGLDFLARRAGHIADAAESVPGGRGAGQHLGHTLGDLTLVEHLLVQEAGPDEQRDGGQRQEHHDGDDGDDQALVRLLRLLSVAEAKPPDGGPPTL